MRRLYQCRLLDEAARSLPATCEPASNARHNSAVQSTLAPGTWKSAPRAITRCLESACAIAASAPAVAGVPRWLRAYRGRASARSCCRAEHLIPAHHHAFGNAFFRSPPERPAGLARPRFGPTAQAREHRTGITRMIARHLFDCAGTEAGARSGSPTIVMGVCWASVRAGSDFAAFSGAVSRAACVPLLTMASPPSPTDALTDDWLRSRGASGFA